jgi:hypothetical protein
VRLLRVCEGLVGARPGAGPSTFAVQRSTIQNRAPEQRDGVAFTPNCCKLKTTTVSTVQCRAGQYNTEECNAEDTCAEECCVAHYTTYLYLSLTLSLTDASVSGNGSSTLGLIACGNEEHRAGNEGSCIADIVLSCNLCSVTEDAHRYTLAHNLHCPSLHLRVLLPVRSERHNPAAHKGDF